MGCRKGRGPEIMSVDSISEMFQKMRKSLPNVEPKISQQPQKKINI